MRRLLHTTMSLVKLSTFEVLLTLSSRLFQSPQTYTYGVAISYFPTAFPHIELSYHDLYEVKIYIKQKSFIESFFWAWCLWGIPLYLSCLYFQWNTFNELSSTFSSLPSFSELLLLLYFIQLSNSGRAYLVFLTIPQCYMILFHMARPRPYSNFWLQ